MCADGQAGLERPASGFPITSNRGPRNCAGCSRNHKGTDYGTPCGTQIDGPPEGCVQVNGPGTPDTGNGYGHTAQFDCGTNSAGQQIKIQYAHLQNGNSYAPGPNLITTGNSGNGTGCHLDYIITVDGVSVDAQCATGTVSGYVYGNSSTRHGQECPILGSVNLCDPNHAQQILNHANSVMSGATLNIPDGGAGTPPQPPSGETSGGGTSGGGTSGGGTSGGGTSGGGTSGGGTSGGGTSGGGTSGGGTSGGGSTAPSQPPCNFSTCISNKMIETAKNKDVKYDKIDTYKEFITAEGECKPFTKTNVTVHRQRVSFTEKYPDAFCINQGCAYVRNRDSSGRSADNPKCE